MALRAMSQINMDLVIFQGKELTNDVYNRGSSRYIVVTTDAMSRHHRGVAVLYRTSLCYAVEVI